MSFPKTTERARKFFDNTEIRIRIIFTPSINGKQTIYDLDGVSNAYEVYKKDLEQAKKIAKQMEREKNITSKIKGFIAVEDVDWRFDEIRVVKIGASCFKLDGTETEDEMDDKMLDSLKNGLCDLNLLPDIL